MSRRYDQSPARHKPRVKLGFSSALNSHVQLPDKVPRSFVDCTSPALATIAVMRQRVRTQPNWHVAEIPTGHDPMISAPEALTSILTSPTADPHLFETSTSNDLAVADAKVVLQNGLGYDAFMTKLEDAAPSKSRRVVTIADVLGVHGKDANPHLWYDVPRLPRIAAAIAAALRHADPSHAARYDAGLRRFRANRATGAG